MNARWYWHVDIDTTKPALERFARALLTTGTSLEPSRFIMGELGRGVSALVVVSIVEGKAEEFRLTVRPIRMMPPIRVCVGIGISVDDGHPGRDPEHPGRLA